MRASAVQGTWELDDFSTLNSKSWTDDWQSLSQGAESRRGKSHLARKSNRLHFGHSQCLIAFRMCFQTYIGLSEQKDLCELAR